MFKVQLVHNIFSLLFKYKCLPYPNKDTTRRRKESNKHTGCHLLLRGALLGSQPLPRTPLPSSTGCSAQWQCCQTWEVTDFRGHSTTAQRSPVLPFPSSWGGLHQLSFLGTCQGCPEVLPAARHVVNSACCQQLPAARRWQARKGAFAEIRDTLAKPGGGSHQVTVLSQRRLLANAKSLHKKGQKSLSGKAGMNLL